MQLVEVHHYVTESGRDPYQQWLDKLKDLKGRVVIQRRIDRLTAGNFGDHKFCEEGVWELRIDFGPGYRVYYAQAEWRLKIYSDGGREGGREILARLYQRRKK